MVANNSHNNGEEQEKERRQPSGPNRSKWWQVKSHNKKGEEQEKERRQLHGRNRREWWQVTSHKAGEEQEKEGASPMGQIGANAGKQKPQQAGRRAGVGKAPAPCAK